MTQLFDTGFREMLASVLRRVRRIGGRRESELRARRQALGRSGTFAGHREYASGEDLRTVDWNVYARTGELFVKVLEEDERRVLTVLLDCSPSMLAGDPARFDGARRVCALLGSLALARLDGLRLVMSADRVHLWRDAAALPRLLRTLEDVEADDAAPEAVAEVVTERGWLGSLCWISDFAVPDAFGRALRLLRTSGRRCTGVLPTIQDDRLPVVNGWVRLSDPETGVNQRVRVDSPLRAALEQELQLLERQQDAVFRSIGGPLIRYQLPESGDYRLKSWVPGSWIYRI